MGRDGPGWVKILNFFGPNPRCTILFQARLAFLNLYKRLGHKWHPGLEPNNNNFFYNNYI
jgi:hypothetical protein